MSSLYWPLFFTLVSLLAATFSAVTLLLRRKVLFCGLS